MRYQYMKSFIKFIIIITILIVIIWIIGSLFLLNGSDKVDQIAQKVMEDYSRNMTGKYPDSIPTDVPDEVDKTAQRVMEEHARETASKSSDFNCNDLSYIPSQLPRSTYYCQNVLGLDEMDIKPKFGSIKQNRIIFYGKYADYNCPVKSASLPDILKLCFRFANYLNDWQLERTAEITRIAVPGNRIHVYITSVNSEIQKICNSNSSQETVSTCIDKETGTLLINQDQLFDEEIVNAVTNESMTKDGKPVTFIYHWSAPYACPATSMPDIQHYFNYQYMGNSIPQWFDKASGIFLRETIASAMCAPGYQYFNGTLETDGKKTQMETFSMDHINSMATMSSSMENLAGNDSCRRAIIRQISAYLDKYKDKYAPLLYRSLGKSRIQSDDDISRAVWDSTGKNTDVGDFLTKNNCKI